MAMRETDPIDFKDCTVPETGNQWELPVPANSGMVYFYRKDRYTFNSAHTGDVDRGRLSSDSRGEYKFIQRNTERLEAIGKGIGVVGGNITVPLELSGKVESALQKQGFKRNS